MWRHRLLCYQRWQRQSYPQLYREWQSTQTGPNSCTRGIRGKDIQRSFCWYVDEWGNHGFGPIQSPGNQWLHRFLRVYQPFTVNDPFSWWPYICNMLKRVAFIAKALTWISWNSKIKPLKADIVFRWVTFVAPVFYHYTPPNHSVNRIFSTDRVGNLGAFSLRTFHVVHLWKEEVVFKGLVILAMSISESHIELA
jgi:hypothetical protein